MYLAEISAVLKSCQPLTLYTLHCLQNSPGRAVKLQHQNALQILSVCSVPIGSADSYARFRGFSHGVFLCSLGESEKWNDALQRIKRRQRGIPVYH